MHFSLSCLYLASYGLKSKGMYEKKTIKTFSCAPSIVWTVKTRSNVRIIGLRWKMADVQVGQAKYLHDDLRNCSYSDMEAVLVECGCFRQNQQKLMGGEVYPVLNVCLGVQSWVTEDDRALGEEPDIGYRVNRFGNSVICTWWWNSIQTDREDPRVIGIELRMEGLILDCYHSDNSKGVWVMNQTRREFFSYRR